MGDIDKNLSMSIIEEDKNPRKPISQEIITVDSNTDPELEDSDDEKIADMIALSIKMDKSEQSYPFGEQESSPQFKQGPKHKRLEPLQFGESDPDESESSPQIEDAEIKQPSFGASDLSDSPDVRRGKPPLKLPGIGSFDEERSGPGLNPFTEEEDKDGSSFQEGGMARAELEIKEPSPDRFDGIDIEGLNNSDGEGEQEDDSEVSIDSNEMKGGIVIEDI